MHVVIIVQLTTIISPIIIFELEWVLMFFHVDFIKNFKNSLQNWSSPTIVVIIVGREKGYSKGEK